MAILVHRRTSGFGATIDPNTLVYGEIVVNYADGYLLTKSLCGGLFYFGNSLPLSGGYLTGGLYGTNSTFSSYVSSPSISATNFYGSGSNLTGLVKKTGDTINGNLIINGSLTALSGATFVSQTVFTTTSTLSINNIGLGPALYVVQGAGAGDVASFYDGDGVEVLHVGNALNPIAAGVVGIKTSYPNKTLTVSGEISASGDVWFNNVYAQKGTYYAGLSSTSISGTYYGDGSRLTGVTVAIPLSSNWNSAYNLLTGGGTVTGAFAATTSLSSPAISAGKLYGDGSSITNLNVLSTIAGVAGTWGSDVIVPSLTVDQYGRVTSVTTYSVSSYNKAQVNYIFDGGGSVIQTTIANPSVTLPTNVVINSWSILSDLTTTTSIDVLTSNYSTYPTFTSITNSNYITISNGIKNTDSTLTNWIKTLPINTIIQFDILSNSAANSLAISLNVTKF